MSKRRGRPRLDQDDTTKLITVAMPLRLYDRLDTQARQTRTTVPDLIRRKLSAAQRTDTTDDPKR
jgi:hypothetical protein